LIEQVFRDQWGRVVAALVGYFGDFDLAEEAAAEAFAIAAQRWPADGPPDSPVAWLVTTARNRAIDRLRRDRVLATKLRLLDVPVVTALEVIQAVIPDDRLELIFTCCHPALATEAQVALTLRAVAGLSTDEIARAFLVPRETMKRRLTRAKSKISAAGIPFRVPPPELLPERLAAVRAIVYLIYNEGYSGQAELAAEAIRLGRLLVALLPADPEVTGLLALMLLHDARSDARFERGELVLLGDQDRSRWNWPQITEGRDLVDRALLDPALLDPALPGRAVASRGPYVIQAAIAALQTAEQLDWLQIAALYSELADLTGSPVVRLNAAVAIAEADGPAAALAIVEALDLDGYQYWHSTRAELLSRLGRADEARVAYREALALARTEPERRFLERRIAGPSPFC
jgi:RNA polymerase sigma-70 factor, ECF subfamily